VSGGNVDFTLIGFAGMYLALGLLFVVLAVHEVGHGPVVKAGTPDMAEGLSSF
jgi:cytochrome d ubiquinol oxidase subunit I